MGCIDRMSWCAATSDALHISTSTIAYLLRESQRVGSSSSARRQIPVGLSNSAFPARCAAPFGKPFRLGRISGSHRVWRDGLGGFAKQVSDLLSDSTARFRATFPDETLSSGFLLHIRRQTDSAGPAGAEALDLKKRG